MGRFIRREVSEVHFVPTIASLAAPTIAEITAGEDLTEAIAEMSGWEIQNAPVATPDLKNKFTKTIEGEDTASDPMLTFYDDDDSAVIRTALAKGTEGFIVLCPYGATATKRCEVWPVRSTGYNDAYTVGNEAAKAACKFAVTDVPEQAATVTA